MPHPIPSFTQWCRSLGLNPDRHTHNPVILNSYRERINNQRGILG